MGKNTSSSETTPKPPRKTETSSISTTRETDPNKSIQDYFQEYYSEKSKVTLDRLAQVEAELPKFKRKATRELEDFKQRTREELSELRSRSDRTIETIGIFAALLSFVTFEAQIFKSDLNGFTLIGLSSLLLGALLLFVFALGEAFNPNRQDDIKQYLKRPLLIFSTFLVLVGVTIAWVGYSRDSQEQEAIRLLNKEIDELKIEYNHNDFEIEKKINELDSRISQLSAEKQSGTLDDFKECIRTQGLVRCL